MKKVLYIITMMSMIALSGCEDKNKIVNVSTNEQQPVKEPETVISQDSIKPTNGLSIKNDSKVEKDGKGKATPDKYMLKIDGLKQEYLSIKGELDNTKGYQKNEISKQTQKIDKLLNENTIHKFVLIILSVFSIGMLILIFIKDKLFKSKKKVTTPVDKAAIDLQPEIDKLKSEIEDIKNNLKTERDNYDKALDSIFKKYEEQNKPKQPKISEELVQRAENLIKRDRELTELLGNLISNDKELAFYLSLIKKEPKTQQDYDQIVNYEIDFKAKFDFAINSMDLTNQSAYYILKQVAAILRLEIIHPQRGDAFMPTLHAANKDEDDSSLGRGKVVRCEKLGYKNSSSVVQKAKIVISR